MKGISPSGIELDKGIARAKKKGRNDNYSV